MKRALLIGVACIFLESFVSWGDMSGYVACGALDYPKYGICIAKCTSDETYFLTYGPSFLCNALPWNDFFGWNNLLPGLFSCFSAWLLMCADALGGLVTVGMMYAPGWIWFIHVRSPKLAMSLLLAMALNRISIITTTATIIEFGLKKNPIIAANCFLMPISATIMFLDSSYLSQMNLGVLDADDFDTPLLQTEGQFHLRNVQMTSSCKHWVVHVPIV